MNMKRCLRAALTGTLVALFLAVGRAPAAEVEGTLLKKDGNRLSGRLGWRASSREYSVKIGDTLVNVSQREVQSLSVRAPEGLQAAIATVQKGIYTGAHISVLERVVADYDMLQHDVTAGQWLAMAYARSGKAADAKRVAEKIMANRSKADLPLNLMNAYWTSLVETGDEATLKRDLRDAISAGAPDVVALANVKMGDIEMKAGRFREALIEGYLRTIVLFGGVKDVQPEAMYKAVKCFQQLGQASRAEKMRKKLLADFPEDSYSKKLASEG